MEIVAQSLSIDDKYNWCLHIAETILAAKIPCLGDSSYFSNTILSSLHQEHRLKTSEFAKMNKKFKSFAANRKSHFTPIASDLSKSFVQLLNACTEDKRNGLFMDLFHMHVNRLFPAYQRTHEMIIYYYLMSMHLMQKFRKHSEAWLFSSTAVYGFEKSVAIPTAQWNNHIRSVDFITVYRCDMRKVYDKLLMSSRKGLVRQLPCGSYHT